MANADAHEHPHSAASGLIGRLTSMIALAGGLLALGVAGLVTASVLKRWLLRQPIPGDFEFVQIATAVSVFAFLPYCQARRGNIVVDTFTSSLPARLRNLIDALWDLVYAGFMALLAVGLCKGAADAAANGTTTMVLGLPIWPAIAACAALCAVLVVVSVAGAIRLARSRP
jgi:TRAP-type C4-dicarboxylate transport system permease small subunit